MFEQINDPCIAATTSHTRTHAHTRALSCPGFVTHRHVNASSTALIYDYFMERKNDSLVADAGKLITQMLIDVASTPVGCYRCGHCCTNAKVRWPGGAARCVSSPRAH